MTLKNNNNEKFLYSNIQRLCSEKTITLPDLSKAANVPFPILQKLAQGVVDGDFLVDYIFYISHYFGIEAYQLFVE